MIRTTLSLANEFAALGYAAVVGAVMGIYYDLFRIIRRVFHSGYATVVSQDVFFFITSAVCVFFAAIISGDGIVRINFVVTVLASAFLYCLTIGAAVVRVVSIVGIFVKKMILRLINIILQRILLPLHRKTVIACEKLKKSRKKGE